MNPDWAESLRTVTQSMQHLQRTVLIDLHPFLLKSADTGFGWSIFDWRERIPINSGAPERNSEPSANVGLAD
jgi:hypothetical protein